ncbi:MAG: glycoside hydrolase family 88 protein [Sphingobacterium sp.]
MNKRLSFITAALICIIPTQKSFSQQAKSWFSNAIKTIDYQLTHAAQTYTPGKNPRSVTCDQVRLANTRDWTTGFFPGSLWYGYELTGNTTLAVDAKRFTLALDSIRYVTDTHDLGFMLYCSYGNAWRLTKDKAYLPVLEDGAKHLAARFNPKIGVIRSWDFGKWKFPVIIDNMMNLDFLYWAAAQYQHPEYTKIASTHALTTMKNHFRKDYSSYHVIDYDPATGKVRGKGTHQGVTDESAWARGQAWGLYGYAMCYAYTKNPAFLEQAQHIADFIMNHPRMPKDKIPVWDFDVHNAYDADVDGRAPRDASAAAVIACGLLDLSKEIKNGEKYKDYAEAILASLSSDKYLATPGTNHFFILKHSVGAFLFNSETDTPLNYADYYYLEALKKYAALEKIKL